jgi:integrase
MDLKDYAKQLTAIHASHGSQHRAESSTALRSIKSIGTERTYRTCIHDYLQWREHQRLPIKGPHWAAEIQAYLQDAAEIQSQKSLDQKRQALQCVFQVDLPRYQSVQISTFQGKDLTNEELASILDKQSDRVKFSTMLCLDAGLRAQELHTIRPVDEQARSVGRSWRDDLFIHRETFTKYSVWGKGGLRRVVAVSLPLAQQLEALRLSQPRSIQDREVDRIVYYDLVGGQSFSSLFSISAKQALGFTIGAHALRHRWAKRRFAALVKNAVPAKEALAILSQESGHFRPSISIPYLHAR